ncbi:MAG TPA: alpha/beta hydrolase [Thermoanaerobaculia bacterium]|jgi:pimeloyl-ACP methyl ester carboxylesterase
MLLLLVLAASAHAATIKTEPFAFKAEDGTVVQIERGELRVPENRAKSDSRTITLRFVRFPSTAKTPGAPIVYLAGGPGGSAIVSAQGTRFPLFMAMREFGDVIALDQRGVHDSEPDLRCKETFIADPSKPLERASIAAMVAAEKQCVERTGADAAAYNTRESAADLNDLRTAIGARKLVLWGISYGTHLAIATMRDYPDAVERVILAGIEGPDETYKLPSDQQLLIEDYARVVAHDPVVGPRVPDLVASIDRVLRELEAHPKSVALTHPINKQRVAMTFGKLDLQLELANRLFAPENFAGVPDLIARLEGGDWTALALAAAQTRFGNAPTVMSVAMDCASGVTAARRARIAEEAKTTLLGDAINLPFPEICEAVNVPDLGDAFRAPLVSDIPALLISGTLDGRTRPRQAEELRRTLKNAQHLVIENAGHSDPLFLSSPLILDAMKAFLRGGVIPQRYITLPPPRFIPVRTVMALPDEKLADYAGDYRIDAKTVRHVIQAGSVLYAMRDGSQPFAIRPTAPDTFFYENMPSTITFERDRAGKVVAMTLRNLGQPPQRAVKE